MRKLAVTVLALLLCQAPVQGLAQTDQAVVRHHLSFPELHLQYIQVESVFPAAGGDLDLMIPVWNPGSYHLQNYDSNVQMLSVLSASGQPLPHTKLERDLWRVAAAGPGAVRVSYRVHAADLNTGESWASPEFVLVNPASVILYTAATRELPQQLSIELPRELARADTALANANGGWSARNYDELVDNPVVLSNGEPLRFKADGQGYAVLNVGDDALWDRGQMLDDVEKVVKEANDLWKAVPFERDYWFFNLLVETGGGLEHDYSTVMMASRWQMRNRTDYVKWLGLVAHEYFHSWNVRRMRPASIGTYDFRNEQYTSVLWLAEGITSYYDDLLLSRAKVVTPTEYFERLAAQFHTLELTPGNDKLSLSQASRDAWTRLYHPDANAINDSISYYTKGAVLGFALDAHIRQASSGRRSLDDVMQTMWEYWREAPYPDHAFADAVEEVAGPEVRDWLEPMIDTPSSPDIDAALEWYGLALERHPEKAAALEAGEAVPAGLGINWEEQGEPLVVAAVIHGLSAAQAGVLPGDELLAINGERVTRDNLEDRKARLLPGERVELLVARRGRVQGIAAQLGEKRPAAFEIRIDEDQFKERQLRRLQAWLGQSVATAD